MCGIAGIYSLNNQKTIDNALLKRMTDIIDHRGPDDEGFLLAGLSDADLSLFSGSASPEAIRKLYPQFSLDSDAFLGMGFRRLSILELSPCGHQPMYDEQLQLAISFNGEIYNYQELREELSGMGYAFRGHSDTEVILKAYHAWGDGCVNRFIGMWAFAIWDRKQHTLFCSRDRYGIKPFYYALQDSMLYWGSEMKQLLAAPIDKSLNSSMIWRSMKINALMVYNDETYWQSIKCLNPGHNLTVHEGTLVITKYYGLNPSDFESSTLSMEKAVTRYQDIFQQAISLQMRSDVEIGASLSGGMDSSAIVGIASRFVSQPLKTFSSYYADTPELDERPWIEKINRHIKGEEHLVSPSADDAIAWWEKAIWLNDLPIAAGFVSQFAVMQEAHRQGVKVLLSGQGSDELHGGYRHAAYRYFADILRSGKLGTFSKHLQPYLKEQSGLGKLSSIAKIGLSAVLKESQLYDLEFKFYRFEPFNREFIHAARPEGDEAILDGINDLNCSRLSNFLYNMMNTTSLQTLLHFEDRISMGNSVESRVPFLDHRLVDFVFSLPSHYKFKPPYTKILHRKAMKKFIPDAIYRRKDKGIFSSPFYQRWMQNELKSYIEDIIHSSAFRNRGIWNVAKINHQWHKYLDGSLQPAEMLYNVISLEIWFRSFSGQGVS